MTKDLDQKVAHAMGLKSVNNCEQWGLRMTQEDVAVLWKDANGWDVRGYTNTLEDLERFAKLVAKHTLSNIDPSKFISCQEVMEAARLTEREACAKIADEYASGLERNYSEIIAHAIRARGEQA